MSQSVHTAAATETVAGIPQPVQDTPSDVMQVSGEMIVLTWIAFLIAAVALHKLLWKPITRAIEGRERAIGDALAGAAKAREEIGSLEIRKKESLKEAAAAAQAVTDRASRDAAAIAARADADAQAAAARRLADADRAIQSEYRKAFEALRLDAAEKMTSTVERLLKKNLTEEQKRAYAADMLAEVKS